MVAAPSTSTIESLFRHCFERMASIRLTVKHVAFANPLALNYTNTMYVEFDTDQVTTDGFSFHTEVVGVCRLRRRKLVSYREYLFDPDLALTVWGPANAPAAGWPASVSIWTPAIDGPSICRQGRIQR